MLYNHPCENAKTLKTGIFNKIVSIHKIFKIILRKMNSVKNVNSKIKNLLNKIETKKCSWNQNKPIDNSSLKLPKLKQKKRNGKTENVQWYIEFSEKF